jgi:Copper type II ascorbate-dependent monooxygenase, C-terminal domain
MKYSSIDSLIFSMTALSLVGLQSGCGGEGAAGAGGDHPGQHPGHPTGARPSAVAGYQRFEAKPTPVAPGQSIMSVQWVAPASDRDVDVLDITGWQSAPGHHVVLYATADEQPVGTVREWQNEDQLSARFIGGSGGEAAAQIKLPPGVVTRVPKGFALLMQVHYMNTSSREVMGESLLDVKLADASPAHRVASFFTSTTLSYELAPQAKTTLDVSCKIEQDVPLLMFANHQHHLGTSVYTEQISPDGTRADVKRDERWNYEWAFNPNFSYRTVDSPLILKAGNTLHTRCEWMNSGAAPVKFPDEMCVFLGFFLGERDINCGEGERP